MRGWVRVEPVAVFHTAAKAFAVFGLAVFVLAAMGVFLGKWQEPYRSAAPLFGALILGFVGLWVGAAWRLSLIGLYLSPGHVHIRRFLTTRTIPWISVTKIRSGREEVFRTADEAPNHLSTLRLWLVLDDDEEVVTPVQRSLVTGGPMRALTLSPPEYERVRFILRTEWRRAVAAVRGDAPGHSSLK